MGKADDCILKAQRGGDDRLAHLWKGGLLSIVSGLLEK